MEGPIVAWENRPVHIWPARNIDCVHYPWGNERVSKPIIVIKCWPSWKGGGGILYLTIGLFFTITVALGRVRYILHISIE